MINFNKQFFKKHQKALLFCANKWYLKWLLGLNRLPKDLKNKKIAKIDVASIHWKVGQTKKKIKYKGAFFSRPRFAEALAFNLSPFCYFKGYQTNKFQWRFSPAGLAFGLLFGYFGGVGFMGTTTNYYAGAGDGYVTYLDTSGQPSLAIWNTVHDATTGTGASHTTPTNYAIIALLGGNNQTRMDRNFFPIDTSGLGDSATISAAILKLYFAGTLDGYNGDGYDYVAVVQTDQPNTAELTTADYNNCGATNNPDKGSANIDISGIVTDAYTDLTFNVTGRGWISKTGTTMLGLREGHDIEDNFPGDPGEVNKYSGASTNFSEQTGTDKDPYLEVTYTTGTDYFKTCSEAITINDTLLNKTSRVFAEAISIVDSISVQKTLKRTLSETITIVDSINAKKIATKILNEAISITDIIVKKVIKTFSETITIVDNILIQKVLHRTLTEAITIVDSVSSTKVVIRVFTEAITIVDIITKKTIKIFTETISIVGTFSRQLIKIKTLSEAITIVDTVKGRVSKNLVETITIVDTVIRITAQVLSETITLTESLYIKLNGVNVKWLRKYSEKVGSFARKYSEKVGTFIKKYYKDI